jgi:hypothetical protein
MPDITTTTQPLAVEHIVIYSPRSFAEVRRKLEDTVPLLDPAVVDAMVAGDRDISILLVRDQGALLQITGHPRHALQYEIGNPLTASRITRHALAGALYAPLRIVLYEDDFGRGVFEYDRPSTLFGQFGDDRVTAVGHELDQELDRALLAAAE